MSFRTTTTTSSVDALRARGITAHVAERVASASSPDLIGAWCAYAGRHRQMTPGALLNGIRSGQQPPPQPTEQGDYTSQVVSWLRKHFADLDRPVWGPHPAAIAAVVRLHYRHGKGSLTVAEHGAQIRAAVAAFEERYGIPMKEGES